MGKKLIIYFSRDGENYVDGNVKELPVGNCARTAKYIQEANGADVFRVEPAVEYPIDYYETIQRAQDELARNARPALKKELDSIEEYDDIYIVGPCWWGTYPMVMFTQLEKLDFTGKTVHSLMSHEGSGLASSQKDLRKILRHAHFAKPLAVHGAATEKQKPIIQEWARQ